MNFSDAFHNAKLGMKVYREGWNGKGLFVTAQFPDEHSKMGNPYLYIDATALGGTLNPWIPSQTDLFAEDWFTVEEESEAKMETYAPSLVPSYIVESDGDSWFAHDSTFTNLQESDEVVFAPTPVEALTQFVEKFGVK